MTHMLRKHQSDPNKIPSTVGIHRDSRVISKVQPKIRIIHIFAPEIIQTEVDNFRELVQRLTGKPSSSSQITTATTTTTTTTSTSSGSSLEKNCTKARKLPVELQNKAINNNNNNNNNESSYMKGFNKSNYSYPYKAVVGGYPHEDRVLGGFLEVFEGEKDYFMQEMGDFSLAPMEANHDHHHHQFGEAFHPLAYRG